MNTVRECRLVISIDELYNLLGEHIPWGFAMRDMSVEYKAGGLCLGIVLESDRLGEIPVGGEIPRYSVTKLGDNFGVGT